MFSYLDLLKTLENLAWGYLSLSIREKEDYYYVCSLDLDNEHVLQFDTYWQYSEYLFLTIDL